MQELSISANQGSQAYGNDAGGGVILGAIVKATVVQKLGDNLYILQVGRNTIEAKVSAELIEGTEYRFVVEKGGQPPELALLNAAGGQKLQNGLTAEENLWMSNLVQLMGENPDDVDLKSLLQLVRALGFDTNMSVNKVFSQIQPILALLPAIDSAPPVIRNLMGQTLLFTMNQHGSNLSDNLFSQAIRLSGDIPKWSETETALLFTLKSKIDLLLEPEKQKLKTQLLGLERSGKLGESLSAVLENALKASPSNSTKNANPSNNLNNLLEPQNIKKISEEISSDVTKRLFLAASPARADGGTSIGSLQRNEAIAAFQRQAPGLNTSDISNLLEQFTSLGGKVEKLSVGDVIAAQLSWKGSTPSAMQLHRTGAVMFLAQDLPAAQRQYAASDIIAKAPYGRLPVVLNGEMVSDPSMSSVSMNKLKEFSQQSSLPNTYHVDRLLQNWQQAGGSLSELRGHLDAINKWNQFIESFPELRHTLAEHLVKERSIVSTRAPESSAHVSVSPETQKSFTEALAQSGVKVANLPQKELVQVTQAIQQVAGEGQTPSKSLLAVATWMVGKGIEITPQSLQALLNFQQGHPEGKELYQDLAKLQTLLQKENPEMAKALGAALGPLPRQGVELKEQLGFYQKGNGQQLQQWLDEAKTWAKEQSHLPKDVLMALQQLQGKLSAQEEFLAGLKHYNIQAQRQDTPKVFEIPVLFGADTDRALLRIYKREQNKNAGSEERNYKIVIDLDLEGLGKIRSEVSMLKKHLQLEFISPEVDSLKVLKANSPILSNRLEALELKSSLGFKLKNMDNDALISEQKSQAAPAEKSNIDISV